MLELALCKYLETGLDSLNDRLRRPKDADNLCVRTDGEHYKG